MKGHFASLRNQLRLQAHDEGSIRVYGIAIISSWTIILFLSAFIYYLNERDEAISFARVEGRAAIYKDLTYRHWASQHGGVYVPISKLSPPNPYLIHIPERDITTPSGKKLTLINPAYMTRQVGEIGKKEQGMFAHLVSLNPLNPRNKADEWESAMLKKFAFDTSEISEIKELKGQEQLRVIRPFITQPSCLKCHANQGYKVGDVQGGISISIPTQPQINRVNIELRKIFIVHFLIWLAGLAAIIIAILQISSLIKQRMESAELISVSEKRYRSLFELAFEGLLVYKGSRIIEVNTAFERMSGFSRDEILLSSVHDFLPGILAVDNNQQLPEPFESRLLCKDRQSIPVEIEIKNISFPEQRVQLISVRNLSERKKAELEIRMQAEALLAYQQQIDLLIKNIPIVLFAIDKNGIFTLSEGLGLKVLGLKPGEVIGLSAFELYKDYPEVIENLKKALTGEYVHKVVNMGNIFFEVWYTPIVEKDNSVESLVGLASDITESIKSQQALIESERRLKEQNEEYLSLNEELTESNEHVQKINQELTLAKEKAEESDRLKTAFLCNISHEIRTPMNGILGFTNLLANEKLSNDKRLRYIELIQGSGRQLLSIINDIIDISKIEAGIINIYETPVNVNILIDELYEFYFPQANRKYINLQFAKGLENELAEISCDETKLRQILDNLISNAIKFTEQGSVRFGYELTGKHLSFFVSDTGIGISPEYQKVIFERFRQVETDVSRQQGGMGLGLAISKAFIEMMDGKIWLESQPEIGTTFFLNLPYKQSEEPTRRKEKITEPGSLSDVEILIVEDEESNLIYLREIIADKGAKVHVATTGPLAVQVCHEHPELKLVFMDIKLPGLNGFEATNQIKLFRPKLPVIALTAYALAGDREKAMLAGCNDYMAKPVSSASIVACLNKYIRHKS